MKQKHTRIATLIATALGLAAAGAQAQISDGVIKIGVMNDMSGLYADVAGPGSVTAARLAVEDFGAARKDETRKSRALSGLRVVKDGYSPQEFYITGSLQAPCSDLYALAATFSHLISGEAPKTSRERLSSIANRQGDPQVPLRGRVRGYPDTFLAAIDKAMSIFPRDRLQSVAEWLDMLAEKMPAIAEVSVVTPPSAVVASASGLTATPAKLSRGRSRDLLVQVAAVALLLAGLSTIAGDVYDRFLTSGTDASTNAGLVAPSLEPFTIGLALRMPFIPDATAPDRVGALLPWSPEWMRQGDMIVEVNGKPVQDGSRLQAMMSDGIDVTGQDSIRVIFGIITVTGDEVVRRVEAVPVVDLLTLEGGLAFESQETPDGSRLMVSALPETGVSGLQIGDVVLTYTPTGEKVSSVAVLAEILRREIKNDVATYSFALQRKGEPAAGGFRLSS